jgi:hypothetical protein
MFEAPQDWIVYYDDVLAKCKEYVRTGYWEEIDKYKLQAWLANFATNEERYFSACLLDALVFRTRKMVDASFRDVASSILPKFLKQKNIEIDNDLDYWMHRLSTGRDVPFRFIAIENVDKKAGKSGSVVIRNLKEALDLAGHLIKKPEQISEIPDNIKVLVLVDDFAGTGEQFTEFYEAKVTSEIKMSKHVLYAPLAAHQDAIKNIHQNHPDVTVTPVEVLDDSDSFFHPIHGYFRGDNKNSVEDAKAFYEQICAKQGFNGAAFMGKGGQCLTFAFHFSTPNNNLKLLYHKPTDDKWKNLLYRGK